MYRNTRRRSWTPRRTPAAADQLLSRALRASRSDLAALLIGPSTCGDIGGETRAARPRLVKCVCFQKGLLRRRRRAGGGLSLS